MSVEELLVVLVPVLVVVGICGSILVTVALTIGLTVLIRRMISKRLGPDQMILQQGIPAQAEILSIQETGVLVNYSPQVLLQLEVHPPTGSPYHATTKAVIPMVSIPQFQPGTQISVKIHPTDRTKVALNLGASIGGVSF